MHKLTHSSKSILFHDSSLMEFDYVYLGKRKSDISLRKVGNRLLRDALLIRTMKSSTTLLRKTSKLEKYFICNNGVYSNCPLGMRRKTYALQQSHELVEMIRLHSIAVYSTQYFPLQEQMQLWNERNRKYTDCCDMQNKRLFFVFNASSVLLTPAGFDFYYIH